MAEYLLEEIAPRYDDEITSEMIEKLRKLFPEDELKDYKIISGPAW